jgi:hypothetical protein
MLLARIYEILPLVCSRCGAAMSIVASLTDQDSVTRILDHVGEPTTPPPVRPAHRPDLFAYDHGPDPPPDSWS